MSVSWIVPALVAVFGWGVSDLFFKLSSRADDDDSHYKIAVWFGAWMTAVVPFALPHCETPGGFVGVFAAHPWIFATAVVYALSLLVTNIGLRHLDLSVQSPLENASAAVPPVVFVVWFLLKGRIGSIGEAVTVPDVVGCVLIIGGIAALAFAERRGGPVAPPNGTNRLGALALLFPLLLTCGDGLETVVCGISQDETGGGVGEADLFLLNSVAFALVGIGSWIRLLVKNRRPYNPFARGEWWKCGAGAFEIVAYIGYIFALGIDPTFVAPVTSSYCLVTIVLSRIFLRERPGLYRYLCLSFVLAGIAVLTASEALKP